jgi:hypothetical protein
MSESAERKVCAGGYGACVTVPFVLLFFAFFLSRKVVLYTKGPKGTKFWTYWNWGQMRQKLDKLECRDVLLYIKNIDINVVVLE